MKITLTIDDNLLESRTDLGSQRLSEAQDQFNTGEAIMEISRRCAALPIQDSCSEDEILGYNDIGTFMVSHPVRRSRDRN
jgi:hypothetical protein